MSLVGTLARVAIAVAAAKGIGYVVNRQMGGGSTAPAGGSAGGASAPPATPQSGGLGDLLVSILGGNTQSQPNTGGGLGGLLEQLGAATGGAATQPSNSQLDDLIRQLPDPTGGGAPARAQPVPTQPGRGGFADMLNQSISNRGEPEVAPTPQQDAAAGLMLRAMLQAAKCDGAIDQAEKDRILAALGDATSEDIAFVNRELASPVDIQGLVRQVPKGLEHQVYAVSVMAIDVDSQVELAYLLKLGAALNLRPQDLSLIHDKLGIPPLQMST